VATPSDLSWLQRTVQNLTLAASKGLQVELDTVPAVTNANVPCAYAVAFTGR
jgi:hypothetical protein